MDNPEKLATQSIQDEKKTKKHTTQHNTTCVEQRYTNSANKSRALLQTTGGKDEPNIENSTNKKEFTSIYRYIF